MSRRYYRTGTKPSMHCGVKLIGFSCTQRLENLFADINTEVMPYSLKGRNVLVTGGSR